LKISPEYLPALEGVAQLEYRAGSQNAVPLLKRLLRLRPDDPTAHAMLAVLAYKKGDCAEAVEHFRFVGSLLDSQPALRQQYGLCLLKLKQPEKAIPVYQGALGLNPADNAACYRLAVVQLIAQQPGQTLDTLAPLLQADKPDARTLELAASAYEESQNTRMAVNTLRQAIVLYPENVCGKPAPRRSYLICSSVSPNFVRKPPNRKWSTTAINWSRAAFLRRPPRSPDGGRKRSGALIRESPRAPVLCEQTAGKEAAPAAWFVRDPLAGFHAFRHGVATALIDRGASITGAQLLRPSDPRITLGLYAHVVLQSRRNALRDLASALGSGQLLTQQLIADSASKKSFVS
jgi:tetratricopeptide (TPR) repeat protein